MQRVIKNGLASELPNEIYLPQFLQLVSKAFQESVKLDPVLEPVQQPYYRKQHEEIQFPAWTQVLGYQQQLKVLCPVYSAQCYAPVASAVLRVYFVPSFSTELFLRQNQRKFVSPALLSNGVFEYAPILTRFPLLICGTRDRVLSRHLWVGHRVREVVYGADVCINSLQVIQFQLRQYFPPRTLAGSEKAQIRRDFGSFADFIIDTAQGRYPERLNVRYNHESTRIYLLEKNYFACVGGSRIYTVDLTLQIWRGTLRFYGPQHLSINAFMETCFPGIVLCATGRWLLNATQLLFFDADTREFFNEFADLPSRFMATEFVQAPRFCDPRPVVFPYIMHMSQSAHAYATPRPGDAICSFGRVTAQEAPTYNCGSFVEAFPDIRAYFQRKTEHLVDFSYPYPDFLRYRTTPFATADLGQLLSHFDDYITQSKKVRKAQKLQETRETQEKRNPQSEQVKQSTQETQEAQEAQHCQNQAVDANKAQ